MALRAVCAMGAVEEDPVIGRGSGVEKVVVGGWGQGMGARGVVHGIIYYSWNGGRAEWSYGAVY